MRVTHIYSRVGVVLAEFTLGVRDAVAVIEKRRLTVVRSLHEKALVKRSLFSPRTFVLAEYVELSGRS